MARRGPCIWKMAPPKPGWTAGHRVSFLKTVSSLAVSDSLLSILPTSSILSSALCSRRHQDPWSSCAMWEPENVPAQLADINPKLRHRVISGPNDDVSIVGLGDLLRRAGEAARFYSFPLEGSFLNHAKCRMIYKTEWREICQVSDDLQNGLERDPPEA
jgi:hypothetical protein